MRLNRYAAMVMFELGHGWKVEPLHGREVLAGQWEYRLKITRLSDGRARYTSTMVAPMYHQSDRTFAEDAATEIRKAFATED